MLCLWYLSMEQLVFLRQFLPLSLFLPSFQSICMLLYQHGIVSRNEHFIVYSKETLFYSSMVWSLFFMSVACVFLWLYTSKFVFLLFDAYSIWEEWIALYSVCLSLRCEQHSKSSQIETGLSPLILQWKDAKYCSFFPSMPLVYANIWSIQIDMEIFQKDKWSLYDCYVQNHSIVDLSSRSVFHSRTGLSALLRTQSSSRICI